MFKIIVVCFILIGNFTTSPISMVEFQLLIEFIDSKNYTCDAVHQNLMQKQIEAGDPCSYIRCTDRGIVTFECGGIKKAYPPCRYAVNELFPFPYCCRRVECPPYYKALDAYIYTLTLIKTGGRAPMDHGTQYSDIFVIYDSSSYQPLLRNTYYIFFFVVWFIL